MPYYTSPQVQQRTSPMQNLLLTLVQALAWTLAAAARRRHAQRAKLTG